MESLFYDTGYEMEGESWNWDLKQIDKEVNAIAEILKIDKNKYTEELKHIIENATYGGHLVIYFLGDIEDYNNIKQNRIMFKDPNVAVIDINGGSGFDMLFKDAELEFAFFRNKLHKDTDTPYPYASDVCGMVNNWCDETKVSFKLLGTPKIIPETRLELKINYNKRFQKTFDAGGCTFGDTHINRHRDIYYSNNYPCGTHCPHCKTFWVD